MIRPKSTAALIEAVKVARKNPRAVFPVPGDFNINSAAVLEIWTRGVHARASRGLPELSARGERRYANQQIDARVINAYVGQRIRNTGCRNLLRDPAMQSRYPHINNQPREF